MNQPKGQSADFPDTEPQPLQPPATPDLPLDVGPEEGSEEKDRQAGSR